MTGVHNAPKPDHNSASTELWRHLHEELVDHGRLQLQSLVIGLSAVTITASILAAGQTPGWWGPLIGYLPIAVSAIVYVNRAQAMAVISTFLRVRLEPQLPESQQWETALSRLRTSPKYRRLRLTRTPHFLALGIVAAALSSASAVLGIHAHRRIAIVAATAAFVLFTAFASLAIRYLQRLPPLLESLWGTHQPSGRATNTPPAAEPRTNLDRSRLKRLRAKWEHEDKLIDRRATWLLAGQSLLVAGYALSQQGSDDVAPPTIAVVGIALAILVGISIWAAGFALLHLHRRWAELARCPSGEPLASIEDRVDVKGSASVLGYSAAALMPFVFIGLWAWLLTR